MIAHHQAGDSFILAQHQPALVLDYARSRELDGPALLRGTGLPDAGMPPASCTLSATQYLQLLANVSAALGSADTSFMLGQQMLPGHYGASSQALLHARNLREALTILLASQSRLCPLLCPRLREDEREGGLAVLYWTDCFGAPSQLPALVEMHMTAVAAMGRWLSGERLPWRFCFNRASPRHREQHEVHLGPQLRFGCHLDAMLIDSAWLDVPWPRGNETAVAVALRGVAQERHMAPQQPSLLTALYQHLLDGIRCAPTLEHTAAAFGVSPATLKRHLARHGTHFQAELDQVRTHVALYLFQMQQHDNDAVARYLGFHDATNFRRSFKRWTGLTPSLLRDGLLAGAV